MSAKREPEDRSQASCEGFLGDLSRLTGQLGVRSDGALPDRFSAHLFEGKEIVDSDSLVQFLGEYRSSFIIPVELPTIVEASRCVVHGEFRELMALDEGLAKNSALAVFSEASQWIGQCHARPMRGMKDHRAVWRYCEAIRLGEAKGWHTVVYGVVLAAFSIPLRQGLVNYCERIAGGFIGSAATKLELSASDALVLQARFMDQLTSDIDDAIAQGSPLQFRIS